MGAEGGLEGNGSGIAAGSSLLPLALGNRQGMPAAPRWGFPRWANSSECVWQRQGQHQGSAAANLSAALLEASRLPVVLEVSFQISAAALVLAAFSGCGLTTPFCHPQKLMIRGKAWMWLNIYTNGLACLACALALVALVLWSYDQGFSAILVVPFILLAHTMLVTLLIVVTIVFQLEVLHQIADRPAQRMLDLAVPGGVILLIVALCLLIKHIFMLQEERCAKPVDLTAVIVGAAAICLFPFLTILGVDCLDMKKRTAEEQGSRRKKQREGRREEKNFLP